MDGLLTTANDRMVEICNLLEESTGKLDPVSCIPAMELLQQAVALRDGISQLIEAREERDIQDRKRSPGKLFPHQKEWIERASRQRGILPVSVCKEEAALSSEMCERAKLATQ